MHQDCIEKKSPDRHLSIHPAENSSTGCYEINPHVFSNACIIILQYVVLF